MIIFALDSSAKSASAALSEDDKLLGEFYVDTGFTHSQTLMPMIKALYKNAGIKPSQTDLFSCCIGPGSFTGVRIGVAAVKGMAVSLDKPCIGISSLEAMAYNFIGSNALICAVMDARRQQVYNAVFEVKNNSVVRLSPDRAISLEDLFSELNNKYKQKNIILVGNGSDLCYNTWEKSYIQIKTAPMHLKFCHSYGVILAVLANIDSLDFVNADFLNPTYLRMSQAQRNLEKGNIK